jgi:hypothetical protein
MESSDRIILHVYGVPTLSEDLIKTASMNYSKRAVLKQNAESITTQPYVTSTYQTWPRGQTRAQTDELTFLKSELCRELHARR